MDRLLEERAARAGDGPQAEKSSGGSLLETARRLRYRKLARQKADEGEQKEETLVADDQKGDEKGGPPGDDQKGDEKGSPDQDQAECACDLNAYEKFSEPEFACLSGGSAHRVHGLLTGGLPGGSQAEEQRRQG